MRKIISLCVLLGGALTGLSQGTVTFLNNVAFATPDPTGGNRLVYADFIGGTKLTGTQYTAELYFGADANSLQPLAASLARFRPITTVQPGTWNFLPGSVTLPGVNIGETIMLQVRVWDNASGTVPYGQATGAKVSSNVFAYTVPPERSPPFAYFMEGFHSPFSPIPEPSVIALGLLGIASLLIFRR